ncbi:MAG: phosphatidate cytidylyltransferase [Actinomycetaceae bacterium]|nr:phosphatidate cytidylyltransferase [Actinomycetaceae bacterium]
MDLKKVFNPGPTQNHKPLPASGRAGRNLPAAISVGVLLAVIAVGSLVFSPLTFFILINVLVVVALWELAGAFARQNRQIVLAPTWVGAVGMLFCARYLGSEATLAALSLTVLAVAVWKLLDRPILQVLPDLMVTIFALMYVPGLASFVVLLLNSDAGWQAVLIYIALAVANDLGGWMTGVLWGKHPMAPRISPKKSWEGFAGSVALSLAVAIPGMMWIGVTWWWGIPLAILTTIAATTGDLVESLIKRDVGLKDMSNLLPGHGGLMDRMDSLLMVAPMMYLVVAVALP